MRDRMKDAKPLPRAALLTGEREVGKTSLCIQLARSIARATGIVSTHLLDADGARIGFSVQCLSTGESWQLARLDIELGGPRYGKFSFSRAGIEAALRCLKAALAKKARLIILDEIGPLELDLGQGLAPILPKLERAGDLLMVAREGLVERVSALVPRHERRVFTLDLANRDALAREIARFLEQ